MRKLSPRIFISIFVTVALLLTACTTMLMPTSIGASSISSICVGISPSSPASPSASSGTPSAANASVPVNVSIDVQNFDIVNNLGGAAVTGQGHVHYFLDTFPPTTQGTPAVPVVGNAVEIPESTYTWPTVAPGYHFFAVELVNNDHTPLNPPVVAAVLFIVPSSSSTVTGSQTSTFGTLDSALKTWIDYKDHVNGDHGSSTPGSSSSPTCSTPAASETVAPGEEETSTPTSTETMTSTPIETETATPTETMTATPTETETETATPTSTGTPAPPETETATPTETSTPSVGLTDVIVDITTQNFDLTTSSGGVIYYLDSLPPTEQGQVGIPVSGNFFTSTELTYTWPDVTAGWHVFAAQLVDADNIPLNPPVIAAALMFVTPSNGPVSTPMMNAMPIGSNPAITSLCVSLPSVPPTGTVTPSPSASITPTPSASITPTPTGTITPTPSGTVTPSPSGTATPTPSASITPTPSGTVTPTPTVTGVDVRVNVTLQNFQVVNNFGGPVTDGEGHLVFYLDAFPLTAPGESAIPAQGMAVPVAGTSYIWPDVSSGDHLFAVQLVNNDDTPLNPPVVVAVVFNVPTSVVTATKSFAAAQTDAPAITSITVTVLPGTSTPTVTPTMTPIETPIVTPTETPTETPTGTPTEMPNESPTGTPSMSH